MAHGFLVSWGRSSVIEWRRLTGEAGSQAQPAAKPSMKGDRDEQSMTGVPMKTEPGSSSLLLPLAACVVIAVVALAVPAIVGKTTIWIFLPGFFTESILLICSLALIAWVSKCNFAAFGFTRGTFRLSARIFLWLLPMAAISTVQLIGSPTGAGTNGPGMGVNSSPVAIVLTIWIYASICEEILARGLLQSWLATLTRRQFRVLKGNVSAPVLAGASFFAGMHVVLWPRLGPATLVVMLLAGGLGLVAGTYRERTGSLIPAILVHGFFDVGGTVPFWVSAWLRHGHI